MRSIDALPLRQLRSRPLRALLTAFGVVLGVGMVFGVLLLVGTIRHTFDDLIGSAWGTTDVVVMGEGGGLLPGSAPGDIEAVPGVESAAGMLGGAFTRLDEHDRAVQGGPGRLWVAGYDTSGPAPYDFRWEGGRPPKAGPELGLERNWARDRGLGVGDHLRMATPEGPVEMPIVGIFRFSSNLSFGGQGLAATPIEQTRRLTGLTGYHQISVAVQDKGAIEAVRRRIQAKLGDGAVVKTPQGYGEQVAQQLDALNVLLYFFSGIALFVGGFLILNSFNMTVLQRMREIGTLRTLGASRGLVTRTILTEAAVIGALGSVLGLGLGLLLASGLIELMRGMEMPVGALHVTAGPAITAVVLGMTVTLLGAAWPARRAGRVSPIRAVLGTRGVRRTPRARRAVIGLALLLPGVMLGGDYWSGGNTGSALAGLLGITLTMAMFGGIAMLAPFVIIPIVRVLAWPLRTVFPAGGRLAADALLSDPFRTAATAAALTIGLSVVVVNSGLSSSFMGTISDQIEHTYTRDFTVQAAGATLATGGGSGVPNGLAEQIAKMPETRAATPIRALPLEMPGVESGAPQGLAVGYDPEVYGLMDGTPMVGTTREEALRGVAAGGLIAGAQYARVAGLELGDRVRLVGPRGTHEAPVVGVRDGMSSSGVMELQVSLDTIRRVYGVTTDAQVAVRARSDEQAAALGRRIDALVAARYPGLELSSLADEREAQEKQVSATFNMFNSIVAIAVIVSLLGVINTLAMSVLERTREIGVLRALGSSRWQVRRTMLDESLLITSAGAFAGIGFGLVIAVSWMRGFAETMPGLTFHFPGATAFAVAAAAIVLGTLAAVLPARRAARLKVIEALAYE